MTQTTRKARKNYIVIGGGIAGVSAAEAIRKADENGKITLISAEAEMPYFRMNLTRYLAGEISASALPLHPEAWYQNQAISLLLDSTVQRIDPQKHQVELSNGKSLKYDTLVLANGASPFIPPFPGRELEGVWIVRTHEDADSILDCCKEGLKIVCIGGGLLGLENAGALAKRGADVTVIETFDWLLPRQLPKEGGKQLEKRIRNMGIKVITGAKVKAMLGEGKVSGVVFEDGTELPADLVLITTGVSSNIQLAKDAGLKVNRGVIVDEMMRTSEPDIFAAGDLIEINGRLYGLWMPAKAQGTVAGQNAAGKAEVYPQLPPSAKLKVLGIDLFSIGQISPSDPLDQFVFEAEGEDFCGFVLRDGKLLGISLLGDVDLAVQASQAVNKGTEFSLKDQDSPSVSELKTHLRQLNS